MAKLLDKFSSIHCDQEDLFSKEVEWVWEVEEATPFLHWLTTYLDSSNCINDRQLRKFDGWCQDGEELFGKYLDQALEEHGIDVQKYISSDLSQFELELLDKELDELNIQNEKALEIENLLSDEIEKFIAKEEAMEAKLKTSQAACQREGQNLMKINVPLKATMSKLFGNFLKLSSTLKDSEDPDIKNCCLSNMPLENTIHSCEKFNEYAKLFLKRKFEQPSYEKDNVSELMSILDQEASMRSLVSSSSTDLDKGLPNKLWKCDIERISLHGTLCGHRAALLHLTKLKESASFEKYSYLQIKIDVANLQDEIIRLHDDIELILKHEVANLAEKHVLYNIFCVVEKITRHRIERRQVMLRKLCSIASVTHKFLNLTDLVWMLLIHESQRFKFCTDLLKEITEFFTDELVKHRSTMNGLNIISNDYNSCSDALRSGQALLVSIVQHLLDVTTNNSDSGNGTLSECQLKGQEYIQLSDVLESIKNRHAGRENSLYKLLSELINGPTKKPNLVKKELFLGMQEVETRLRKCNADSDSLATTFSSKQLVFKKDTVSRNRRLLWAWFLVAPDQLEEALRLAKESKRKK